MTSSKTLTPKSSFFWLELLSEPVEIPLLEESLNFENLLRFIKVGIESVLKRKNLRVFIDVEKETIYVWRYPEGK